MSIVSDEYKTAEELESGLATIRQSPRDEGILEMIVCRPQVDSREVIHDGQLDLTEGLVGDNWRARGSSYTPDNSAALDMQLTVMNSRAIALIAQTQEHWPLAGDQLFIDMDLSQDNLPPGTRLQVGSTVIEVTSIPHTGCKKFMARFGLDALKFVNSPEGKRLNLRGINAKVVQPGSIQVGDLVRKV